MDTPPHALASIRRLEPDEFRLLWSEATNLIDQEDDALVEALDAIVDEPSVATWVCINLFVAAWMHFLGRNPPALRTLVLVFESIEMRASEEGVLEVTRACRLVCPYLAEVLDDDLLWTDFRLPGEEEAL